MREQIKGLPAILPLKTFVNVWAFFAFFFIYLFDNWLTAA